MSRVIKYDEVYKWFVKHSRRTLTDKSCMNCVYLANDNKWCAKNESNIYASEHITCSEWVERNTSEVKP